jgi:hypothetical protein
MCRLVFVASVMWAASARADSVEQLKGNVLVWHDAALYLEPADDAQSMHVAKLDAAREQRVGHAVPMRVVATHGDFVEVEVIDDAQCAATRIAKNDDITKLHLYVKRADLAPALVKAFDKTFADGTHIALKPGVPLAPAADGRYAAVVRGHAVELEIPSASVGYGYTSDRPTAFAIGAQDYVIASGAAATLGDRAVAFDGLHASKIEAKGDTTLVTFEDRCTAATVAVAAKSVHPTDDTPDSIGASSGIGVLDLRGNDYIPAATAMTTVHGHPLAVSAKPIYLMDRPMAKTVCVVRRLRLDPAVAWAPAIDNDDVDDHYRVCAPTARVTHERVRTASASAGSSAR